jgi:hypothetical protein
MCIGILSVGLPDECGPTAMALLLWIVLIGPWAACGGVGIHFKWAGWQKGGLRGKLSSGRKLFTLMLICNCSHIGPMLRNDLCCVLTLPQVVAASIGF